MNRLLLSLVALSLATSACIVQADPDSDGSLTVRNSSSYVIAELYVTPIDDNRWGSNLLGRVLFPDEQLTIHLTCDVYDVLIADDYGRECEVYDVDLCFSNAIWTIDNETLRYCEF